MLKKFGDAMGSIHFWDKLQERILKVFYAHSTFHRAYPFVLKKWVFVLAK